MAANYKDINRNSWNNRVDSHLQSDFYDLAGFKEGKNSLNEIELALLGEVKGKKILHLQCHFGQDTLSLARMGAEVTGVDISDKAINTAQNLAEELDLNARFICCDVYDLPQNLNEQFDVVLTSYGTIGWLPDINKWASVVAQFVKPGGQFVMAEFHPVVWMYDNDLKHIAYRYFNTEPIEEMENGTYADKQADIEVKSITWNHGLAEVLQSLIGKGFVFSQIHEYDWSPYDCLGTMTEASPGKFQVKEWGNKVPLVYAFKAEKKV